MMPKPGDVLTVEQVYEVPEGAVVDVTYRRAVAAANYGKGVTRGLLAMDPDDRTVTLVSLPTPPDMAPGSVVLDEGGRAWARNSADWWYGLTPGAPTAVWSDLAPRVARVLHDAGGVAPVGTHDCTSCGASNDDCLASVHAGKHSCCALCYSTDTHGDTR